MALGNVEHARRASGSPEPTAAFVVSSESRAPAAVSVATPGRVVHISLAAALAVRTIVGHLALPLLAVLRGPSFLVLPVIKPSEATMTVGGAQAGQGPMFIVALVILGAIGALLSDTMSFFAGKVWGERALQRAHRHLGGRRISSVLQRTTDSVTRGGGLAIVLARPTVVAHGVAPIVAGASGFSTARFLRLATIGAVVWAVLFSLGGIAVGQVWHRIDPTIAIAVAATALVMVALFVLARRRGNSCSSEPC